MTFSFLSPLYLIPYYRLHDPLYSSLITGYVLILIRNFFPYSNNLALRVVCHLHLECEYLDETCLNSVLFIPFVPYYSIHHNHGLFPESLSQASTLPPPLPSLSLKTSINCYSTGFQNTCNAKVTSRLFIIEGFLILRQPTEFTIPPPAPIHLHLLT